MKAYELYKAVSPSLVQEMFSYFRDTERDVYKTSLASLAGARKLRPVFVQKKPVVDQIAWMHKTLQSRAQDAIGEHLLQVWFMKGHQPMLIDFCNTMDIPHNGEGSVEGELPADLDPGKLKEAADTLLGKDHPGVVALYLHVFNLQRPGGWDCLQELLAGDARLHIGERKEEVPEPEPAEEESAEEEPAEEESAEEESAEEESAEEEPAPDEEPVAEEE